MIKRICLAVMMLLFCAGLSAQTLRVKIFSQQKIKETMFIPSFGRYTLDVDGKTAKLTRTSKVKFKENSSQVEVEINDTLFAKGKKAKLIAEGLKCFFQIKPLNPAIQERRYDDGLEIYPDKKGG